MTAMLFPGHVDSCTQALLRETRKAAKEMGVRVQIHATINLFEFHTVMQRERCTPIELLHKIGFLDPEVSLSHCIFISGHSWLAYPYADDLKIIADSGASVVYSPLKYLKLGITMESFDRYRRASINMGIGTDTFPKDILSDMRYAAFARGRKELSRRPSARRVQRGDVGRREDARPKRFGKAAKRREGRHHDHQLAGHRLWRGARSHSIVSGNRGEPGCPHGHR
jgi:cytosine/adenosine deaminase-related metal-dependent hydrolase